MKEEAKDPALGTIVKDKIKVDVKPDEPMIHAVDKPRKGNPYKLAIIIMSIIIFLLLAGLAYFLFCPLAKTDVSTTPKPEPSAPTCPDQTACEDALREESAVKSTIAQIKDTITTALSDNNLNTYIGNLYQTYDTYAAYYKPADFDTAVPLDKSYGLYLDAPASDPIYSNLINNGIFFQLVENTLINAGFTNTGENYTTASAGIPGTIFFNQSTGVVCNIDVEPIYTCGYKDWYSQADAELSNTLMKVYRAATDSSANLLVAKTSAIKDSPVSPYQTISVGMTGYGASFWRANPNAKWQYFAEGQSAPACSAYNTEDLRKAFAGTSCFPDTPGPMATVQP